jgi:predicted alpha/beta hydrolase
MKKEMMTKIGLAALALLLFSSFKNKPKLTGTVLVGQGNPPTGTRQVYSKDGTRLFDKNGYTVLIFDQAGIGMTVTGEMGGILSVVYGDTFSNGLPAYVNSDDVIN